MLREDAIKHISQIHKNIEQYDFYEFGIYGGRSFFDINEYIKRHNAHPRKIWGFDSFCGLPLEEKDIPIIKEWTQGEYNSQATLNTVGVEDSIRKIMKASNSSVPCEMIPGFFAESLTSTLKTEKNMKPACFIDVDVDLYISTIQLFDFMVNNELLAPTTIINFDDWGGVEEYAGGESKAFKEVIEKYNLSYEELFGTNPYREADSYGVVHVKKVFAIYS